MTVQIQQRRPLAVCPGARDAPAAHGVLLEREDKKGGTLLRKHASAKGEVIRALSDAYHLRHAYVRVSRKKWLVENQEGEGGILSDVAIKTYYRLLTR